MVEQNYPARNRRFRAYCTPLGLDSEFLSFFSFLPAFFFSFFVPTSRPFGPRPSGLRAAGALRAARPAGPPRHLGRYLPAYGHAGLRPTCQPAWPLRGRQKNTPYGPKGRHFGIFSTKKIPPMRDFGRNLGEIQPKISSFAHFYRKIMSKYYHFNRKLLIIYQFIGQL